jgi:hypothetical protein
LSPPPSPFTVAIVDAITIAVVAAIAIANAVAVAITKPHIGMAKVHRVPMGPDAALNTPPNTAG